MAASPWVARARGVIGPWRHLLRRSVPFSDTWGSDRGTAVDRLYIDAFLESHRADIRGRVIEVQDARYTRMLGTGVISSEVVDLDPASHRATLIADLCTEDSLPEAAYDCAIVPQTLQYLTDPGAALRTLARALAPGGVLLATAPGIIAVDLRHAEADRWRFTAVSLRELACQAFDPERVEVESRGNLPAAIAFLAGMALEEVGRERISGNDPRFPVSLSLRATRA